MTVYFPNWKPVVSPLTSVTLKRELPVAGEVLVEKGDRVEQDDIVARTLVPGKGRRFPVAHTLGIEPKTLADRLLLQDGDGVEVNDVLIRVGRWRQRGWRCPIAGTLSTGEVEQGYLIVTPPARNFELRAHLKGSVVAVEPYRGVSIETPAALVQGAFGLGGERHGVLRTAVSDPGDVLTPDMLDERSAFSILVGGASVSAEALNRAVELQVRGLIVGSMAERDLRLFLGFRGDAEWDVGAAGWSMPPRTGWQDFPLTLMMTEGVGHLAMCSRAFELLASYDGGEASLDGRTWLHGAGMCRPTLIIPLSRAHSDDVAPDEGEERLALGSDVRLLSSEFLGHVGTVVGFSRGRRPMACGVRYFVVEVHLEDGRLVEVPPDNLEIMGPGKQG